jgi:two-component system KDP operon response regulator KdpE
VLRAAAEREPDIVVLDLGLPDVDGIDVCRALRRWTSTPVIVLSADGAEDRKVQALDHGADDYVTKPYAMGELLARLRVALRHHRALRAILDPGLLVLGDLQVDVGGRAARVGDRPLELARKEFDLLLVLARNPGRVLTYAALVEQVWGAADAEALGALRQQVTKLRKKLGEGRDRPRILTEHGVGYRLILGEEVPNTIDMQP